MLHNILPNKILQTSHKAKWNILKRFLNSQCLMVTRFRRRKINAQKKTCKQISLFGMFPFYIKRMRQKIVLAAKH